LNRNKQNLYAQIRPRGKGYGRDRRDLRQITGTLTHTRLRIYGVFGRGRRSSDRRRPLFYRPSISCVCVSVLHIIWLSPDDVLRTVFNYPLPPRLGPRTLNNAPLTGTHAHTRSSVNFYVKLIKLGSLAQGQDELFYLLNGLPQKRDFLVRQTAQYIRKIYDVHILQANVALILYGSCALGPIRSTVSVDYNKSSSSHGFLKIRIISLRCGSR